METLPNFSEQIQAHLDAIADLCRAAGSPQWADHATLILGNPQDLLRTVILGYQDLDGLLRFVQHLQAQATARGQAGVG